MVAGDSQLRSRESEFGGDLGEALGRCAIAASSEAQEFLRPVPQLVEVGVQRK